MDFRYFAVTYGSALVIYLLLTALRVNEPIVLSSVLGFVLFRGFVIHFKHFHRKKQSSGKEVGSVAGPVEASPTQEPILEYQAGKKSGEAGVDEKQVETNRHPTAEAATCVHEEAKTKNNLMLYVALALAWMIAGYRLHNVYQAIMKEGLFPRF